MSIIRKGSPTEHFIQMRSKYFVDDVSQLDVAVLRPPNMGNQTQRLDFLKVLQQFEATECSTDRQQTKFWFFAYQSYLNELGFGDFEDNLDLNYTVNTIEILIRWRFFQSFCSIKKWERCLTFNLV